MSDVTAKTSVGSASNSDVAYVSMSDESELSRMMAMQPGIGDAIYDDETLKFAADMGIITEVINNGGPS